jgi:putative transposase
MNCPHYSSTRTSQLAEKTSLGYKVFLCSPCRRKFNERTGTAYNHLQFPTDVVLLVVLWRLRYKLSLQDLAEMFLIRGFEFTKEGLYDRSCTRLGTKICSTHRTATAFQASR